MWRHILYNDHHNWKSVSIYEITRQNICLNHIYIHVWQYVYNPSTPYGVSLKINILSVQHGNKSVKILFTLPTTSIYVTIYVYTLINTSSTASCSVAVNINKTCSSSESDSTLICVPVWKTIEKLYIIYVMMRWIKTTQVYNIVSQAYSFSYKILSFPIVTTHWSSGSG